MDSVANDYYEWRENMFSNLFSNIFYVYVITCAIVPIILLCSEIKPTLKKLYGIIGYELKLLLSKQLSDEVYTEFYNVVVTYDEEKLFDIIADMRPNDKKICNKIIETSLSDKKHYIIDVLMKYIVGDSNLLTRNVSLKQLSNDFMKTFLFCYELDYGYTKSLVEKAFRQNPRNPIISLHQIFFSDTIEKPIVEKYKIKELIQANKELENENNKMKEHIMYMPDGEKYFEMMESFYNNVKRQ
jgi:hypothetical protein